MAKVTKGAILGSWTKCGYMRAYEDVKKHRAKASIVRCQPPPRAAAEPTA